MDQRRIRFLEKYGRSAQEAAACAAFVREHWNGELEHRLRIADEVTRRIFLFDLPWDMEQTAEPVTFEQEIDWLYQPSDDPEFIYQMNRHRYWVCLGQAYAVTGEERYARCFAEQLTDWIEKNPITDQTKPKTWRTIEAGLRAESWIKAMGYMAGSPSVTDEIFLRFVEALACHGEYLAACDVPFSVKSNWGVLENSGLYAIGNVLETVGGYPEGAAYARLARKRLTKQIAVQVMDDGVHWEQSPMYHNEVLKCYLEALRMARLHGDSFPEQVTDKIRKMAYANRFWQKPDGSQPAGGDSDVTDLRDVLTGCAYWFCDPVLKSGGYGRLDYESVWDYGMEAAGEYEALSIQNPEETLTWLRDSGNWYLRSSWGTDADYLHVRCGSLGGGHGHFDKLHLDLVVAGEEILTDPGRYTYVDGEARRRLKSARAHNSLTVDGEEYTRCLDSWGVKGLMPAVTGNCCRKGDYTLIECSHLGYMENGIYVERRILAIGTRIYLILDTCYAEGSHTLEQHFHPSPELGMTLTDRGFVLEGNKSQVEFICVTGGVNVTKEEFGISRHYNQMEPASMVTIQAQGKGTISMMTAVICQEKDRAAAVRAEKIPVTAPVSKRILEDREAEGVVLRYGSHAYLVVNAHVEAGADCEYIGAQGSYGLGRVMVTDESADEPEPVVMKW